MSVTINATPIFVRAKPHQGTVLPLHSQLTGGIREIDFRASFPVFSGGVRRAYLFPCEAGIQAFTVLPPTDPIAASIGQGAIIMKWQKPAGEVWHYNIYGSLYQDREYGLIAGRVQGVATIVSNLPVGVSLYVRITTVHPSGQESAPAQVRTGVIAKPLVLMSVRMLRGSVIPNEAVFGALDPNTGSVDTFSAVGDIVV